MFCGLLIGKFIWGNSLEMNLKLHFFDKDKKSYFTFLSCLIIPSLLSAIVTIAKHLNRKRGRLGIEMKL
jgi:hypothetical protein